MYGKSPGGLKKAFSGLEKTLEPFHSIDNKNAKSCFGTVNGLPWPALKKGVGNNAPASPFSFFPSFLLLLLLKAFMNKFIAALAAGLFAVGASAQTAATPAAPAAPAPAAPQAAAAAPAHKGAPAKSPQHKKVAKKKTHKAAAHTS